MITKHEVYNFDKHSAQLWTSMKILKHMATCQERGKTDKFIVICVVLVTKQWKTLNPMNKSTILTKQEIHNFKPSTIAHDPKELEIFGISMKVRKTRMIILPKGTKPALIPLLWNGHMINYWVWLWLTDRTICLYDLICP